MKNILYILRWGTGYRETLPKVQRFEDILKDDSFIEYLDDIKKLKIGETLDIEELNSTMTVCAVKTNLLLLKIAKSFSALLERDFTNDIKKEIIQRNIGNHSSCCATHDYCDANEYMLEAFTAWGFGHVFDVDDDSLFNYWNSVWETAKYNKFWWGL